MTTAQMQLIAFKVTNFRSVKDSGWIDAAEITALIGTNESGKTNLLVPLWKLNPAKEGEIKLLSDAPRKEYNTYRQMENKPEFIHARFELADALATTVAVKTGKDIDDVRLVEVSRDFDANYRVHFPNAQADASVEAATVRAALNAAGTDITAAATSGKGDEVLKGDLLRRLTGC